MPQFAIEFDVNFADNETLAASLNGLLLEHPTWKVVIIHTTLMNRSNLATSKKPTMISTVVIDSPEEDMPTERGKDFIESTDIPAMGL